MATPVLISWTIALLMMIVVPIAVITWFKLRYNLPWLVFLYGALIFLVFQMLTRIPLLSVVSSRIIPAVQSNQIYLALYFAGLGFSAGLFESVGRWAGYKWLFPSRFPYDWQHGIAFGLGHGAVESILLVGLSSGINLLQAMQLLAVTPEQITAQFPEAQAAQALNARTAFLNMSWTDPLAAGAERLMTIFFHVAMSLIVLQVFRKGQIRWLWLAVLLHGLVDFGAVALGNLLHVSTWGIELFLLLWAAVAVWIIVHFKPTGEQTNTI